MTTDRRPCDYCGTRTPGQIEHSVPKARGGTNHTANLAHACSRCNAEKSDRTVEEWAADRVRVGLSWPPIGLPLFSDGTGAELDDDGLDLVNAAVETARDDMKRTVLDLYDAARNVPTFTYAKAAADLLTAARKAHAA